MHWIVYKLHLNVLKWQVYYIVAIQIARSVDEYGGGGDNY